MQNPPIQFTIRWLMIIIAVGGLGLSYWKVVEVHLNSFVRVTLKPGEVVHVDSPERAFDWVPIAIIAAVIGPACIFILSNRMSYKNQQLNKARATKSTDAIIRDYLKLLDATDPQATKGATKGDIAKS